MNDAAMAAANHRETDAPGLLAQKILTLAISREPTGFRNNSNHQMSPRCTVLGLWYKAVWKKVKYE